MESKWKINHFFDAIISAPSYHLVLEGCLFIWILWLLLKRNKRNQSSKLTEQVFHSSI